eukprot:6476483-Prymnesium_polylepis.1
MSVRALPGASCLDVHGDRRGCGAVIRPLESCRFRSPVAAPDTNALHGSCLHRSASRCRMALAPGQIGLKGKLGFSSNAVCHRRSHGV